MASSNPPAFVPSCPHPLRFLRSAPSLPPQPAPAQAHGRGSGLEKLLFAAGPLILPSYPRNVGTLIPRSLISQATLSLWV